MLLLLNCDKRGKAAKIPCRWISKDEFNDVNPLRPGVILKGRLAKIRFFE